MLSPPDSIGDTHELIGEHVHEDHASREIIDLDPADVITAERARELYAPLIDKVLP